RRTFDAKHPLRCKRGDDRCMAINRKTTGRKCRCTRLSSVFASCTGGGSIEDSTTEEVRIENELLLDVQSQNKISITTTTIFLDHETLESKGRKLS
ncbi:hypothetical protein PENTCL1PPCAC_13535, partial [Pristionchus entomophagus]